MYINVYIYVYMCKSYIYIHVYVSLYIYIYIYIYSGTWGRGPRAPTEYIAPTAFFRRFCSATSDRANMRVKQQTCLLCGPRHVCCVTQQTCLLCGPGRGFSKLAL